MSSVIDFNILLAKADKNTNNACKLLEEKKQQNLKNQQKLRESAKEILNKNAALAFIKSKKEEIRMRTEIEAKELLEKKQKKDKKETTSFNLTNHEKASKTNIQDKNKTSIKKLPINLDKSKIYDKSFLANTTVKNNSKKDSQVKSSSSLKNSTNSKKPSIIKNKPKISYDQMLNLADNFNGKLKTNINPNNKSSNLYESTLSKDSKKESTSLKNEKMNTSFNQKANDSKINNSTSKFSKTLVIPTKNNENKNTPSSSKKINLPETSNKKSSKDNLEKMVRSEQKSISSWDRIISDMKKKPIKNKNEQINVELKSYDEYEDEYDSEMDDFIDDEDVDDNSSVNKKDYSKCIQEIFNYNPKRYIEEDIDLNDMETDFHSQLKEEKRSLKLGILEDLEELKKEAELDKKRSQKKRKDENDKNLNSKKLKTSKT